MDTGPLTGTHLPRHCSAQTCRAPDLGGEAPDLGGGGREGGSAGECHCLRSCSLHGRRHAYYKCCPSINVTELTGGCYLQEGARDASKRPHHTARGWRCSSKRIKIAINLVERIRVDTETHRAREERKKDGTCSKA